MESSLDFLGGRKVPRSSTKVTMAKGRKRPVNLRYIHKGTEERAFIDEALFSRVVGEIEQLFPGDSVRDMAPLICCAFKRWAGGKGLLGCMDKVTTDYMSKLVAGLHIDGQSLKARPGVLQSTE